MQGMLISFDEKLRTSKKSSETIVQTSTLTEELGQI